MSGLGAFGAFAGGVAGGYERGLALREKIEKRKQDKEKKEQEEQIKQAGIDWEGQQSKQEAPIEVQDFSQQPDSQQTSPMMNNAGLSSINYMPEQEFIESAETEDLQHFALGGVVKSSTAAIGGHLRAAKGYGSNVMGGGGILKSMRGGSNVGMGGLQPRNGKTVTDFLRNKNQLADGGLVEQAMKPASYGLSSVSMAADPNSLSFQTNQESAPQTQQAPSRPPKTDFGKKLSGRYNAMRDKALELGRMDLAKDYHDLGFQVRDKMFKEGVTNAQREFQLTGDIKGFVGIYNDALDDGANIEGYEKTANGFILNINNAGNQMTREVTPDEIKSMVMEFSDPAARYAAEAEYNLKTKLETFKTDEDIRKENSKGYTLNQGDKRYVQGKLEADNPKADGGLSDLLDVQKAAENPNDPNFELANKILARQMKEKVSTAAASRAPRAEREIPFEQQAYQDWAAEPQNKGKGKNQYLREKATWSQSAPLDSVTEATVTYDDDGNEKRTSRTSKIKPKQPAAKAKPAAFNKDELFKKYGIK